LPAPRGNVNSYPTVPKNRVAEYIQADDLKCLYRYTDDVRKEWINGETIFASLEILAHLATRRGLRVLPFETYFMAIFEKNLKRSKF